jgi:hypothetical protein
MEEKEALQGNREGVPTNTKANRDVKADPAVRNNAHIDFYNERAVRLARHLKAKSMVRNLPKKTENVVTKRQKKRMQ